jgi:hypothetical protein
MSAGGHNRRLPHRNIGVRLYSINRHNLASLAAPPAARFGLYVAATVAPSKGRLICSVAAVSRITVPTPNPTSRAIFR